MIPKRMKKEQLSKHLSSMSPDEMRELIVELYREVAT